MSKYQNKYRIESTRLKEWDYSTPWWYYVTINTKNHVRWFGEINNSKMILNDIGKIVETEWLNTPKIRENVDLDYYVIMPNHLHGIIIINEPVETTRRVVSTTLQPNSLGSIIGQFKSVCTKQIRKFEPNFNWQSRFYDRIIRNENELYKIRRYIEQNPLRWDIDKNIPGNLEL